MTPATYRLPPRGRLVILAAGAVTLAAAARVACETHPQPVLLDALLWAGLARSRPRSRGTHSSAASRCG